MPKVSKGNKNCYTECTWNIGDNSDILAMKQPVDTSTAPTIRNEETINCDLRPVT